MTEDLRTRLDREFEDCTPDIIIDSAGLMERGKRRKRSRYAVAGTAALALVMALVVVVGNLPGRGGTPNPTTSGSPVPVAQPEFPLPGDLAPEEVYHWVGPPGIEDLPDNPEMTRLQEALLDRLRAHGANPDGHLMRYRDGLEAESADTRGDQQARWDRMLTTRLIYTGVISNLSPGTGPDGRADFIDSFDVQALPKGSFERGPGSIGFDGHSMTSSSVHLYTCDDYADKVGDGYVMGDVDNTCVTTDLPDGGQLVTIESRTIGRGNEGPRGSDTAILFLANGNAYMITNVFGHVAEKVLRDPTIPAAELGELLRSLPEVIIY
ncbi:hypothetical protein Afil01_58570 [Actinorhabdospora filicis]|uniref:Uncharacterized protein n=1 Tax=Actinorhabdospora filicis TaxID=1785913 RepID=A0A9W6WDP6_9ACTN|nr:hypothetical protein [Actinorhabdospora filicis]GLZ81050.1 hypothetical protein Afil01_58570 [Actinorhabdospora filicis]